METLIVAGALYYGSRTKLKSVLSFLAIVLACLLALAGRRSRSRLRRRASQGAGVLHRRRRTRSCPVRTAGDARPRRPRRRRRLHLRRDHRLGRSERHDPPRRAAGDLAERHAAHTGAASGLRALHDRRRRVARLPRLRLRQRRPGRGSPTFMGGSRFAASNWPSLPARVNVDDAAAPDRAGHAADLRGADQRVVCVDAEPARAIPTSRCC